ncbi:NAD(+) diphosphatase [soil metagenome]
MTLESLGFGGGIHDRAANNRTDAEWLAARRADPTAWLVRLAGDRVLVQDGRIAREPVSSDAIFIGIDPSSSPVFAAERVAPVDGDTDLRSIAIAGAVPPSELGLLAQARSLLLWHQHHGFCANCGAQTGMADGGYRRHCPACGTNHFPRTDPVVIMVVRGPRGLLLGRQKKWSPGLYSALAGFLEPGETIEDAARREVHEESGIRVGAVSYVASQPWPFPSSLMIGLVGEALNEEIHIDANELEDARWFPRDELLLMRDGRHEQGFRFPFPMAIAHHLIMSALEQPSPRGRAGL